MRIRASWFFSTLLVVVLLSACGGPVVIPGYAEVVGVYSMSIMTNNSPAFEMVLYLNDDYSAELSYDYLAGDPPIFETGTWLINSDGTITVRLTKANGVAMYPVVSINFALENGGLTAVSGDDLILGMDELRMQRI